eukprot:Anaeramoba_ignava/a486169_69.p1 GENE.a486169_69~~a486169_69.p1  ORF type:complete len:306 (-),score=89.96 a486169_69:44-928(-)
MYTVELKIRKNAKEALKKTKIQEALKQPSEWFKNPYYFLAGGSASVLSEQINTWSDGLLKADKIPEMFFKSGLTDLLTELWKKFWVSKYHLSPLHTWKRGILIGICVAASRTFLTVVYSNIKQYHQSWVKNQEWQYNKPWEQNAKPFIPRSMLSTAMHMPIEMGIKPMTEGFLEKAAKDALFLASVQGFVHFNSDYIAPKIFNPKNTGWINHMNKTFFLGGLSTIEASLVSKPLEMAIDNFSKSKNKSSFSDICKSTLNVAKERTPRIAWKVFFYAKAKEELPKIYNSLTKKLL